jgi:hypothetical protein
VPPAGVPPAGVPPAGTGGKADMIDMFIWVVITIETIGV